MEGGAERGPKTVRFMKGMGRRLTEKGGGGQRRRRKVGEGRKLGGKGKKEERGKEG